MAADSITEVLRPLAFVQSLDNRSGVLACSRCGAFIGSARAQVAAIHRPTCAKGLEEAIAKEALPELQTAGPSSPSRKELSGIEFCRNGCGELFCSSACEISAFNS